MTDERRKIIAALMVELNTGLLDEDEFNRRADEIGLTEAEADAIAWGDPP